MKQQHTLQPKLRFSEFEGDWISYSFKEIFNFTTGKNIKQKEAAPHFETPCVRYGELYYMYKEVISNIINYTNLDKTELKFSEGDEILLPSAGEDPMDIGSASALTLKDVAIGRTINILKPKNKNVYSSIFASYYINQKLRIKISGLAKGVSISNVYNTDLQTLFIKLPSLPEQQKIADYLSTVDNKINLLEEKKAQLALYKKAMMQKLFSQEIRFKDDNGNDFPEWEEKRLGEIAKKMQSGGTPKASNRYYYIDGTIPFLSISDITEQGKYLTYAKKTINKQGIENSSSWIVPINSLIYSMYASVGFVTINKIEIATSQAVMNIILKEIGSLEYIYYYLSYFKKFINRFIETGTQGNINAEIVKNIKLPYPSLPEQQKIAEFLSTIDESIEKVNEQISQTQSFKKAMLQQMFV